MARFLCLRPCIQQTAAYKLQNRALFPAIAHLLALLMRRATYSVAGAGGSWSCCSVRGRVNRRAQAAQEELVG